MKSYLEVVSEGKLNLPVGAESDNAFHRLVHGSKAARRGRSERLPRLDLVLDLARSEGWH